MKNARLLSITILVTVFGFSPSAWAQPVCDTTFTLPQGVEEGDWILPANWAPDQKVPDATLVACIPSGLTAFIDQQTTTDEHAKAIWVQDGPSGIGTLELGGTLTCL